LGGILDAEHTGVAPPLLKSGYVTEQMLEEFYAHYRDPHYWTRVMTFTANWG
jgi:hypothetical protein